MLCLSFSVRGAAYALPARDIIEVLPVVELRPVPRAPAFVRGLMDFGGQAVPVLDLARLAADTDCAPRLSTRIILIDVSAKDRDTRVPVGLMVEHATDTIDIPASTLREPPLHLPDAPFLGRMAEWGEGLIQLVEPAGLLLDEVRALLPGAAPVADGATIVSPAAASAAGPGRQ